MRFAVLEEYATGRTHHDGSSYLDSATVCWCDTRAMAEAVAELWASRMDVRGVRVVPLMEGAPAHREAACAATARHLPA